MSVTHSFVSAKSDGSDTSVVRPSDWNAAHVAETALEFIIDGSGSAITTGIKGDLVMPFAGHFTGWTVLADQTGSVQIDLWRDLYANFPPTVADTITGSDKPRLSSAAKATSSSLSGWTTSFAEGDVLRINVDSAATLTRVTLVLLVAEP